ncbi:MAG TPA: FAD binding domain-containing protein, partial [Thermoanaerobaculia bacterium]|nr:FAD binding domain-containing protein [Thermoanaerobaculia bacterium]
MRDHILFYLNGVPQRVGGEAVFQTVSRWLREVKRATGTKIVCEEGDCGACTVLVGRRENGALQYRPVNSCIQFLFQLDCTSIVTVEGLAPRGELAPVQEAMIRCQGAQCGYCTPGFIVAMAAMAETGERDVRRAVTGNLCRCTGYEPIMKAADAVDFDRCARVEQLYPSEPMLRAFDEVSREAVQATRFFQPATLEEAVKFKGEHPKAIIVQGATDVGVWSTKRGFIPEAVLSLRGVAGLEELRIDDGMLIAGARVSLADFETFVVDRVPELREVMDRFGSPQIKNAGTIAGNIANASPIADTLPFLFVMGARLELTGAKGSRLADINSFYRGYKTLDLAPDEIITRILIPLPAKNDVLRLYKISKRSHLDISTFTAAFLMRRTDGRIDSIRIAYGGVGPVVLRLPKTEAFLEGKPLSLETFEAAGELACSEITPISDVRGSREYRLQLAREVMKKFYYDVERRA